MKLTFLGATGTVTGSKYLLEVDGLKILIDCGLFQGFKDYRKRNWQALPIRAKDIDAVILTHAHIDHSGYIPRLVKSGFRGTVYASKATIDLCEILLPDCGYLQEEDAKHANKHHYSKHQPAQPLYTEQEAEQCLRQFKPVNFGERIQLDTDVFFRLERAGHILGAASVILNADNRTLAFSGDLGRMEDWVMKPPVQIQEADYLVLESTYGNRLHEKTNPLDELEKVIQETIARGGTVIIPAFAVGRAQTLLYCLYRLKAENRIPEQLPIYLDSPMSIDATELLLRHGNEHRLSKEDCLRTCHIATYIRTTEESKALNPNHLPCVIISASGMATGGRILHHLKHYLPQHRNTVILAGYQAEGTRGDRLQRGEKEIKIHGQMVPVNAHVVSMNNLSAHADYEEILSWLRHFRHAPKKTFITHGTPDSAQALKEKIEEKYAWAVQVPEYLQEAHL